MDQQNQKAKAKRGQEKLERASDNQTRKRAPSLSHPEGSARSTEGGKYMTTKEYRRTEGDEDGNGAAN